ncbi:helix-turn-helix transcriptional regulator [Chitinibacteraceae bacterium HSL-7]
MPLIYYERFDIDQTTPARQVGSHVFHKASYPPMRVHGLFMCGVSHGHGGFEVERIDAPFHTLIVPLAGEVELFEDGQRCLVTPGQFGVTPAGRTQRGFRSTTRDDHPHVWLLLKDDPRWAHFARDVCFSERCEDGPALWDAVSLFQREAERHERDPRFSQAGAALELLSALLERAFGAHEDRGWRTRLDALFRFVAKQPDLEWDVSTLAGKLGVTPTHLNRLCRQHYGMAPGQKTFDVRMQEARTLLAAGERVSDVAGRVGYKEVASFSRRFRTHFGVSPSRIIGH